MRTPRVVLLGVDQFARSASDEIRYFFYSLRMLEASLIGGPSPVDSDVHVLEATVDDPMTIAEQVLALDPDLVGMSAYVWSFASLVEVALELRRRNPRIAIVMGGPAARVDMFGIPAYAAAGTAVDLLVAGEGERAIRDLVRLPSFDRETLSSLPGVYVSSATGWRRTPGEPLAPDVDALISPYVLGTMRGALPGMLQTFRNCPLACRFCTWGAVGKASRVFSAEHIARELKAFARLGLTGALMLDAGLNLNAQAFRNLEAAEREVGFLKGRRLHTEVYPSTVTERHLAFLASARSSVGMGLQTLNHDTLRLMNRPSKFGRFKEVAAEVSGVAHVTAELILGLPGDSPESFRASLDAALELGGCVDVSHCLVLPDGLLSRSRPEFAIDFDPKTLKMKSCLGWTEEALRAEAARTIELCRAMGGFPDEFQWRFACGRRDVCPANTDSGQRTAEREIDLASSFDLPFVLRFRADGTCSTTVETPSGPVVLDMRSAGRDLRAYAISDGVAFSYRASSSDMRGSFRALDAAIARLSAPVATLLRQQGDEPAPSCSTSMAASNPGPDRTR